MTTTWSLLRTIFCRTDDQVKMVTTKSMTRREEEEEEEVKGKVFFDCMFISVGYKKAII